LFDLESAADTGAFEANICMNQLVVAVAVAAKGACGGSEDKNLKSRPW